MIVVAAVDESESASSIVAEANYLATELGMELHVLHVKQYKDIKSNPDEIGDEQSVKEQTRSIAKRIGSKHADEFTAVGLIGTPKEEIVSYAEEHDVKYIVTSGRKRSPTGKAMFGSTSQYVILHAGCSVVNVSRNR